MTTVDNMTSDSKNNSYYNTDKSDEYYIDDVYFSQYESESGVRPQKHIGTQNIEKPASKVQGAVNSLYEHETRKTLQESGVSHDNVRPSAAKILENQKGLFFGVGAILIFVICLCAIFGSLNLLTQRGSPGS